MVKSAATTLLKPVKEEVDEADDEADADEDENEDGGFEDGSDDEAVVLKPGLPGCSDAVVHVVSSYRLCPLSRLLHRRQPPLHRLVRPIHINLRTDRQ